MVSHVAGNLWNELADDDVIFATNVNVLSSFVTTKELKSIVEEINKTSVLLDYKGITISPLYHKINTSWVRVGFLSSKYFINDLNVSTLIDFINDRKITNIHIVGQLELNYECYRRIERLPDCIKIWRNR